MGVNVVTGEHGNGKSSFANALTQEWVASADHIRARKQSKKLIRAMNAKGFNYTLPKGALVWANHPMRIIMPGRWRGQCYEFDSSKLMIPSLKQKDTVFIPPGSRIIIDESQMDFDSHKTGAIPPEAKWFLQAHRHNDYDLWFISQRGMDMFNGARELGANYYHMQGTEVKYGKNVWGRRTVIKVKWHGLKFDSWQGYSAFISTGSKKFAEKFKYVFHGNIFEAYDHQHMRPLFFFGKENVDFDRRESKFTSLSLEGFQEYQRTHKIGSMTDKEK